MNDEEENEELNEEPASNEPVNVLIKRIVAGKVALYPRSEYSPTTSYEKLNLVSYQGSSYICIKDCVGIVPTNTEYWYLNAQKGDKGDTGNGIEDFEKTRTEGSKDYYTITFTDGSTKEITVENGTMTFIDKIYYNDSGELLIDTTDEVEDVSINENGELIIEY